MTRPVILRPVAHSEFDGGVDWYRKVGDRLASQFVAAVDAVLEAIAISPERYPFEDADVREAPVKGFPYAIYDRVRPSRIVVLAIFHQSRDPDQRRRRA